MTDAKRGKTSGTNYGNNYLKGLKAVTRREKVGVYYAASPNPDTGRLIKTHPSEPEGAVYKGGRSNTVIIDSRRMRVGPFFIVELDVNKRQPVKRTGRRRRLSRLSSLDR
jgi:hypothetical protein